MIKNGLKPFENIQQLEDSLDDNQKIALGLLEKIKSFYHLSIENEIDTDLHIGNFRVKNNQLILTDFRESIEEGNLIPNKRTEFREFKKDLGSIFTPKFLNEYFKDSLELLEKKQKQMEEKQKQNPEKEYDLFGISYFAESAFN